MTVTDASIQSGETIIRRHPIRGAVWGLLLGIGASLYSILFSVVAFGDWLPLGAIIVAAIVIGVLWGQFAPPKKPKGPPPRSEPPTQAPLETQPEDPPAAAPAPAVPGTFAAAAAPIVGEGARETFAADPAPRAAEPAPQPPAEPPSAEPPPQPGSDT